MDTENDNARLDLLRRQVDRLHAMLDADPHCDFQSLIALLDEVSDDAHSGMHRTVMINLVRRGLDALAIEYATNFGLSSPPIPEQYVGPLDGFVYFALASARQGDYQPSRELFARLRPVRAVEEFAALIEALPLSELDNDGVSYGYGIWCMQEIISGRQYPQKELMRQKWDELMAHSHEQTQSG